MSELVFVTPADARHGFSLAGARQVVVKGEDVEATLRRELAGGESKVVVVDERLLAGITEERFQEMERKWFGVLVVLPAPAGAGALPVEDYALRLIRRAIGYHVRLQS